MAELNEKIQKVFTIAIFVILGVGLFVAVSKWDDHMLSKILKDETARMAYDTLDRRSFWEVTIQVREELLREIARPDYIEWKHKEYKKMGMNIWPNKEDVMKRKRRLERELAFAKKQLRKLE